MSKIDFCILLLILVVFGLSLFLFGQLIISGVAFKQGLVQHLLGL